MADQLRVIMNWSETDVVFLNKLPNSLYLLKKTKKGIEFKSEFQYFLTLF